MATKIIHEIEKCIGCGLCESLSPEFWKLNHDEGKAHLKGATTNAGNEELTVDSISNNQEVAEACPVNCIHIEKDGKRII